MISQSNKLQMLDILHTTGITTCMLRNLCNYHNEFHEHLFFQFHYSRSIWDVVSHHANLSWPSTSWMQLLQWANTTYKRKKTIWHHIARKSFQPLSISSGTNEITELSRESIVPRSGSLRHQGARLVTLTQQNS